MKNPLLFRILLAAWVLGIFYVSLTPRPHEDFPLYLLLGPIALHFIAFFVLFILFYFSFPGAQENIGFASRMRRLGIFWLLTVSVAVAKEAAQLFVPGRFFSLNDILLDAASALVAALAIAILSKRSERYPVPIESSSK